MFWLFANGGAFLLNIPLAGDLFSHYFSIERYRRRGCRRRIVLSSASPRISDAQVHDVPFSAETILSWPLSRPADAGSRAASPHEIEVVELFEELRDRLLRYLLALGLSAQDGEEIVQESFLLLFQHLQQGKPRQNLRGWVFRVARNLALKQRAADQMRLRRVVEFDETLPEQSLDRSSNPEEQF